MRRVFLLLAISFTAGMSAFGQTHNITGKILDENNQGFPGAAILVKGTAVGSVTDANGDFNIDVPDGKQTLTIQALGYQNVSVRDTGQQSFVVHLKLASKELEAAVVTALGIKREKRELGYSSTTINNEDLTSGGGSSALDDLQGKVAGANITSNTGGPGGSTRVVLRGEKSILKDNNALIVIDGVIMNNFDRTVDPSGLTQVDFGNSANDLDPDEIESITVLEGPAAAALYGSIGANGALMITTKAGKHREGNKKSKLDVTYKATYTESQILKLPEIQGQYGQGNLYVPGYYPDDRQDNFSWGPQFDNQLKPWGQIINGQQLVKPYSFQPDALKSFFNNGKTLNNFLSIAGGSENSTYFLSINAMNNNGIVPSTFYNKYSVRFNASTELSNNFYSSVNVNYINNYSRAENGGQSSGGVMQNLLLIPNDIPIWELSNLANHFYSMDYIDTAGTHRYGYFGGYNKNPYWAAQNYKNLDNSNRIVGDYNIGYKKGEFNVYDRMGIDFTSDETQFETPAVNDQPADQTGRYAQLNYINNGGYSQTMYNAFRFYNDLIANYAHQFNQDFGINALIGDNVTMKQDRYLNGTISPVTSGLVIPGFYSLTNNSGPITGYNTLYDERTFGIYADIKLNYKKELFVEMTGRNDINSTLPTNHNSFFYPGINASWVFTERIKGAFKEKVMNYGKIRMGTSGVGAGGIAYVNNPAAYNQTAITSSFGSIVPPFNSTPAYQIQQTFGPGNLKPELTREYEVGTDLSFFKDRIMFSFTYYNDYTHNLISQIPTPPSSGYQAQYENVGDISNKGEEISLRGTPISTKWGLKWDLFGTYTHNVSDVVSLNNGVQQVSLGGFSGMNIVAAVGHPYGTFYSSDITYWNGHAVVNESTGLPVPTSKPVYEGTYQPKFIASWGTDLSYKGLKLHVLFTTKQGGEYYSETKALLDFNGNAPETVVNGRNPYVWNNSVYQVGTTGNYVKNTTPFQPYNYWVNVLGQNEMPAQFLVNASYVKLQEISLSYKIPTRYYKNTCFGGLEAGMFGNNLILWTAKSNKYDDPSEGTTGATSNAQGFNFNGRPSMKNFGAFIKVTF